MCENFDETIYNLFVSCSLMKAIWNGIWKSFAFLGTWEVVIIEKFLWNQLCNFKVTSYLDLPFFFICGVWLHRNKVLFENVTINVQLKVINILNNITRIGREN